MGMHYRDNEEKINVKVIIIGVVTISILVSCLIVYFLSISSRKNKVIDNMEIGQEEINDEDDYLEIVSVGIGKSVNEIETENNPEKIENEVVNIVENSSSANKNEVEKNDNFQNVDNTIKNNSVNVNQDTNTSKEEVKFISPVTGAVIKEFAPDSLVYSETLEEWTTHMGIDIKADKTSVVTAAANGVVTDIKNDPRYGLTVKIKHDNGYETIYANLLTAEFVVEGEEVKAGQTIGTIGNSANFEIADDYHLHFEMLKDGEYVDPSNYIA